MSSAAHAAAAEGNVELLKSALEADPEEAVRGYGPVDLTLLMLASARGHVAAVSCLLDAGADPNAVNANGETALIFAASFRWPDVVRVPRDELSEKPSTVSRHSSARWSA